jgi:hypothetical protein
MEPNYRTTHKAQGQEMSQMFAGLCTANTSPRLVARQNNYQLCRSLQVLVRVQRRRNNGLQCFDHLEVPDVVATFKTPKAFSIGAPG